MKFNHGQVKTSVKELKETMSNTQIKEIVPIPTARLEKNDNSHPHLFNIVLEILDSVVRKEVKVF